MVVGAGDTESVGVGLGSTVGEGVGVGVAAGVGSGSGLELGLGSGEGLAAGLAWAARVLSVEVSEGDGASRPATLRAAAKGPIPEGPWASWGAFPFFPGREAAFLVSLLPDAGDTPTMRGRASEAGAVNRCARRP